MKYFGYLKKIENITKILVLTLVITGAGFLFYTGHLGATLVYQQAAGIYVPSEDRTEFE